MSIIEKNTTLIKSISKQLGFDYCGISKAEFLETEAPKLTDWLKNNRHGKMAYMENHFDKRLNPTLLVEGSKSVVSLLYNYYPEKEIDFKDDFKISKYAYGYDYHDIIKDKLKIFFELIYEKIGKVEGRYFVDSAPVMDKVWAKKAGLGWIGKNSNLINKKNGSFFFIAELILDLELLPDIAIKDYCGTCTRCLDACPTDAIIEPYIVDGSKCISYLTIELKDEIPEVFRGKMEKWVFGCDICQDVCPWNRFSKPTSEAKFNPIKELIQFNKTDWQEISETAFKSILQKSPIKRTKIDGLKRNMKFIDLK